jgi:lipopolysaccharide transport system permease protein
VPGIEVLRKLQLNFMAETIPVQPNASIPMIRIEHSRGWVSLRLRDLWEYCELLYFLVWRDVKVRYKQTVMGLAWVIIQPLLTIIIFTLVFSYFARISSDGLPYPVFLYAGLLPWTYFASAMGRSGNSLLADAQLIEKIYFPRLIMPVSSVVSPLVDFMFSFMVLLGVLFWYGFTPTWGILVLPLFLFLAVLTALSVGLWLAPLNVRYRDVVHLIPFLLQIWMYLSPVIYPISAVPERWRLLYSLNPMVGVIEGFRWALLAKGDPALAVMAVSAVAVMGLLWGGLIFFKRMERTFADVI